MNVDDEAQLARLMAACRSAEQWEWEQRTILFAFLQHKMQTEPSGIQAELIRTTGYSKQRLADIKAGRWSRTTGKNPE